MRYCGYEGLLALAEVLRNHLGHQRISECPRLADEGVAQ